jgi:hypothetical protein
MNEEIIRAVKAMANSPVRQYVLPGLTSELVGGDGHGRVRLLTSDRHTRDWVTPHSHRFDFTCLVLAGSVENIVMERGYGQACNAYARGTVRPRDGGMGQYEIARTEDTAWYAEKTTTYGVGETYSMRASEIHSIRFSRGAKVLFFEGPDVVEESVFLEPVCDGKVVQTFETRPWMFERETPVQGPADD